MPKHNEPTAAPGYEYQGLWRKYQKPCAKQNALIELMKDHTTVAQTFPKVVSIQFPTVKKATEFFVAAMKFT